MIDNFGEYPAICWASQLIWFWREKEESIVIHGIEMMNLTLGYSVHINPRIKGVLTVIMHPRPILWLYVHFFPKKLQHIGDK